MEKLILILGIAIILLLIVICLLLLKVINKLYSREIKEKREERLKAGRCKIKEKESDESVTKWYNMNFMERCIFHTNFVPGFKLEKLTIEEEKS